MRRALACAVALAALLLAAPAHAFVLGGHAWPGGRITYFNADRAVAQPVALAVHAWNASGAHVRFVAVPRSRARVVIQKGIPSGVFPHASIDQGFCTGFADIGYQGRQEHVYLDACSGVVIPSGVIAHELGHILGLGHETRRCATMQPIVWTRCNQQAKGDWQYRCRIVQPDDVAGAIHLYGGHARRLPGPFCDLWQPPGPASDVSVGPRGSSVSWTSPPLPKLALNGVERPALQAQIVRSSGACPLKQDAAEVGFANVQPGRRQTVTSGPSPLEPAGPGTWCYGVKILDDAYRGAPPATTTVTFTNQAPTASFTVQKQSDQGPNCFMVTDASTDPDGRISRWHWDFGNSSDPYSSFESGSPPQYYCYAQPGTYTVTLTVTDNDGASASTSQQVQATDQPPPPAT